MPRLSSARVAVMLALAVCAGGGCRTTDVSNVPQPPLLVTPGPSLSSALSTPQEGSSKVTVTPAELVAPIGTQVVMIATVCKDGYFRGSQRVEWTLSQDSVGQFVNIGGGELADAVLEPFDRPAQLSNSFVRGVTYVRDARITRDNEDPCDDFGVKIGQTWVSVGSVTEGTSYITAHAPWNPSWSTRHQTAVIHWVDAQWVFPAPVAAAAGGSVQLSTQVTRQNGAPHGGWTVRYEILSGPPAGFGYDDAQRADVATDVEGRGTIELSQPQAAGGTSVIRVQIIRPQPDGRGLVLGEGTTSVTWTGAPAYEPQPSQPQPTPADPYPPTQPEPTPEPQQPSPRVEISATGPARAEVGEQVKFVITVRNRGDAAAENLVIVDRFAPGFQHAQSTTGKIERPLPDLAAGESREFPVTLDVLQAGRLCHVVEIVDDETNAVIADKLVCLIATAPPAQPQPPVQPPPARPAVSVTATSARPGPLLEGQRNKFSVVVRNSGATPLTQIVVRVAFDPELTPDRATEGEKADYDETRNELTWTLDRLAVGGRKQIDVECVAAAPAARACCRASASADEQFEGRNVAADAEACVQVRAKEVEPSPIGVTIASLDEPTVVGRDIRYVVRVTNNGQRPQRGLVLETTLPDGLTARRAGTQGQVTPRFDGQAIRFDPFAELQAGESITYQLRVRADRAGKYELKITVRGDDLTQAAVAVEESNVNAE